MSPLVFSLSPRSQEWTCDTQQSRNPRVAGLLLADTGLAAAQSLGAPVLGDSQLPLGLNIMPLFKGKVLVRHKAGSGFVSLELP